MRMFQVVLTIVLGCLLGACGSSRTCDKPQPYEAAREGQQIEAPDGLDELRSSRDAIIPEASREMEERNPEDPCIDFPPVLRTADDDDS